MATIYQEMLRGIELVFMAGAIDGSTVYYSILLSPFEMKVFEMKVFHLDLNLSDFLVVRLCSLINVLVSARSWERELSVGGLRPYASCCLL